MFIKNLPETVHSKIWGLTLFSFGEVSVKAGSNYPSSTHFKEHGQFWERGRVLTDLFLVYIAAGSGEVQFLEDPVLNVKEGSFIILYPGEKHRYRPKVETGWTEYWMGIRGHYVDMLIENYRMAALPSLVPIKEPLPIIALLTKIKSILETEPRALQVNILGHLIELLTKVYLAGQQETWIDSRAEQTILEARHRIQMLPANTQFRPKKLAQDLGVGYSWFRKVFKQYMGCSPLQYHIYCTVQKASELLLRTSLTVKEVAYKSGFSSEAYFCRQFKQKQGMSPTEFRMQVITQNVPH